jgi:hypothetical protein
MTISPDNEASPMPTASTTIELEPSPSAEQEITLIANNWAPLFAAGEGHSCSHMTQPLCERIACVRVGGSKIRNCTPPTRAFRKSFEDATVQEIAIKRHRAAVRFSNGKVIELYGDGARGRSPSLRGNAGREFFE